VSASVNLPLHHKVQEFSSGTGSPRWSRKNGRKTVVVVWFFSLRSIDAWMIQLLSSLVIFAIFQHMTVMSWVDWHTWKMIITTLCCGCTKHLAGLKMMISFMQSFLITLLMLLTWYVLQRNAICHVLRFQSVIATE